MIFLKKWSTMASFSFFYFSLLLQINCVKSVDGFGWIQTRGRRSRRMEGADKSAEIRKVS